MLDLEIIPEKSISSDKWQIILGMSFYQVIQILKSNCETIKTVQLIYNDKDPISSDYMLNLVNDGIILYFDSHSQRLKLIEISDLKKLRLRYYGNYFNNLPVVQPTFEQIIEIFGITSPGFYDNSSSVFLLQFPGLLFTFSIDYRVEPKIITHGIQSLQFPAGRAPLVTKISIYHGNSPNTAIAPEIPSICLNKDIFANKLQVVRDGKRTCGIHLSMFMQGAYQLDREMFEADICFNDSCQDVMSLIGTPSSVYYKSEESSNKLASSGSMSENGMTNMSQQSDYFYNYITLGLDILFDSKTNRAIKIVLHSNFPCHYNFNSYFMCNFEIPIRTGDNRTLTVTPATTLQKLQESLNIKSQPAILHRSSSTNSVNPFGPTFFYAYDDIIFEVMTNGYIASVTLVNKPPSC